MQPNELNKHVAGVAKRELQRELFALLFLPCEHLNGIHNAGKAI
jgi:hypothetical protein